MAQQENFAPELDSYLGEEVVIDVHGPYTYIGTLERIDANSVDLSQVDVHAHRDTNTSIDRYLLETRRHGIRVNRSRATVLAREILSISPLSAVVLY